MKIMSLEWRNCQIDCRQDRLEPRALLMPDPSEPLNEQEFERQLRANGYSYDVHHPFHVALNSGRASVEQIRGWVANRFYYQIQQPIKDAAILANCTDRAVRREWVLRILDQDGHGSDPGGIEAWVRLGEAVGLTAAELWTLEHVVPGVRLAVDAYISFARRQPWQEVICTSLPELLAPTLLRERFANWSSQYPWIEAAGLDYFRARTSLASRELERALRITLEHFRSRDEQVRALELLKYKLELRWSMLDAIHQRYS